MTTDAASCCRTAHWGSAASRPKTQEVTGCRCLKRAGTEWRPKTSCCEWTPVSHSPTCWHHFYQRWLDTSATTELTVSLPVCLSADSSSVLVSVLICCFLLLLLFIIILFMRRRRRSQRMTTGTTANQTQPELWHIESVSWLLTCSPV